MDIQKSIESLSFLSFTLGACALLYFSIYGSFPIEQEDYSVFRIEGEIVQLRQFEMTTYATVAHMCEKSVIIYGNHTFSVGEQVQFIGTAFNDRLVTLRAQYLQHPN